MEQRLEKKFVFLPGDNKKIETLKIEGSILNPLQLINFTLEQNS